MVRASRLSPRLNGENCFYNGVSNPVAKAGSGGLFALFGISAQVLFSLFLADDAVRLAELQAVRNGEKRAPAPHQRRLRGQHVR